MGNKTTAQDREDPAMGRRLQQARKAKGYTQRDMAEIIGITTAAYQNYEYGKEISSGRLVFICAALDCSPNWLLGVKDNGMKLRPDSLLLQQLHEAFDQLSTEGQREALRRVRELARLDEYRKATGEGSGDSVSSDSA